MQPIFNATYKIIRHEQIAPDDITASRATLIDGARGLADITVSKKGSILPQSGQLHLHMSHGLWKHPAPLFTGAKGFAAADLGRPIHLAGSRDAPKAHAIAHDFIMLSADFPTADGAARARLERLVDPVAAFFPETPLLQIDLATGAVVERTTAPLDRELTEWSHGAADRYLSVRRDGREGPWIGTRVARPGELDGEMRLSGDGCAR